MEAKCNDCDGIIKVPDDVMKGEIVSCPDCGLEYEVSKIESGKVNLNPAEAVGEDWGE